MTCAGCNLIETNPITLIDGTTVCTSCESWRVETFERDMETKRIMAISGIEQRRDAITAYQNKHGAVAGERLRECIQRNWKKPV